MRTWEKNQYEVLVRVRDFWNTHRHLFPESTVSVNSFATLVTAVDALSDHANLSKSVAWEGRRVKRTARAELLERFEAIARTARVIAEDAPGFDDPFRLPKHRNEPALLTAGRAFVSNLEPVKNQFVDHGMPETFIADLQYLVTRFEQAIRHRDEGRKWQSSAQIAITGAVRSGFSATRKLDAIVRNHRREDSELLAAWDWTRGYQWRSTRPLVAAPMDAVFPLQSPAPTVGKH